MNESTVKQKPAPRVRTKFLPLFAGIVWGIAATAILSIGMPAMFDNLTIVWLNIVIAVVVFGLFFKFVFFRLYKKHLSRIKSFEKEKICMFAFFDVKGYIIMACMITLGIILRNTGILPPIYLGMLYTGLGFAMAGASICFLSAFFTKKVQK
ncbi:MAG: hypothetical protein RR193_03400 [Christensenellaceae bacterium]